MREAGSGERESSVPSKSEIFELLSGIMVERFGFPKEKVVLGAHIVEDLDLDSLDAVDLVQQLEEATGHDVDDDLLRGVTRLQDLVNVVHGTLGTETA
jgi:acyl carrier protein